LATYRDPDTSEELLELAKNNENRGLKALKFDVSKRDTFASFVKEVSDVVGEKNGLNMVIHNAGYMAPNRELDKITPEDMIMSYEVTALAPYF